MKRSTFLLFAIFSFNAVADIDFSLSVHCSYQKGQALSDKESENVVNSTPMKWSFNSLLTKQPTYMSGGDSGNLLALTMQNGVSAYLPDQSGSHSFTIFNSGKSFWNKQWGIMDIISSQQYIGTCKN